MLKQTEAYRAALAQLADALVLQVPADVIDGLARPSYDVYHGHVCVDLQDVLRERHPDFGQAMNRVREEREQREEAARAKWRAEHPEDEDDRIPFD
jgi:hypothetical protein